MPPENQSSSNHRTRTFTLDSLTVALEQVQALHEISADLIAENVFDQPAQQGSGEPVATYMGTDWKAQNQLLAQLSALEPGTELYTNADPVEVERLRAENIRLDGLKPEGPPRPPSGDGLPRYGLRWNGPQQPIAVPMDDGYWTPWHLADRIREDRDGLLEAGAHTL